MSAKRRIPKRSHSRTRAWLPPSKTLGQTIRKLREGRGLSLRALAKAVGVSAPFMCDVEHDRRKTKCLAMIATVLLVSPEKLWALDNRVTPELKAWLEKSPDVLAVLRQMQARGRNDVSFMLNRKKGRR